MAQSVELNDEVVAAARRESARQSRSVAGQIAHWVRIGRAIEQSGRFDYRQIQAALEAALSPDELSAEEHEVWLAEFGEKMSQPTEEAEAFFSRRRRLGLGVGLSEAGEIVREKPPS